MAVDDRSDALTAAMHDKNAALQNQTGWPKSPGGDKLTVFYWRLD
ncbi:MAG: hypothetical protein RKR03_19840 [Candidatus Competibacter sp.]|nr:hypothetical protein [Candidatus Competibacter sp.]MDS4071427.1 hypothetical protein [Candidatus Competibacter sp.]